MRYTWPVTPTALDPATMQPPSADEFSTALGRRIAQARGAAGLSQAALAEQIGYGNQSTVSLWESGTREPSLANLTALARVLAVTSDYLLGLEE